MKRLSPIQGLTLFFLIGLILLTFLFRGRIPLWHSLIFRYLLWIGLLFVIKLSSDPKRTGRFRDFVFTFSPLLFIILIYESLGDLIHYLHPDIDPALMRIDLFLFGVQPTLWMQRWIVPWLTDLLSLAYLSYYFLPLTLVVVLYLKKRPRFVSRPLCSDPWLLCFIHRLYPLPCCGPPVCHDLSLHRPIGGKLHHPLGERWIECHRAQQKGLHAQWSHPDCPHRSLSGLSI